MRGCDCEDFKKYAPILDYGIYMIHIHGGDPYPKGGVFRFCPWCGKPTKIVEDE